MKSFLIVFVLLAFLSGLYVYMNQSLDYIVYPPSPELKTYEGLQSATAKTAQCPNVLIQSGEYLLLYNSTDTHDEMPITFNNLEEYATYIRKQRENGIKCPVLFLQKENDVQGNDVFRIRSTPYNDIYNEPFTDYIGMTLNPFKENKMSFPAPLSGITTTYENKISFPFYNIEAFDGGMGSPAGFSGNSPSDAVSSPSPVVTQTIPNIKRPDYAASDMPQSKDDYKSFDAYGVGQGKYTDLDKIHDSTAASTQISDNPMDPNWGGTSFTQNSVDSGKYIENNVYPVNFSMPGGVQFYPGLNKTYPDPPNFVTKLGEPAGVRGGKTI
jgi:hypothetical protein